jgi:hypothetical protein
MSVFYKLITVISIIALTVACQRKNCPVYWANSGEGSQKASDGAKVSGENLNNTETGSRTVEFPLVRVKRDKNGVVVKKRMGTNKVKRTDPRKSYRTQK